MNKVEKAIIVVQRLHAQLSSNLSSSACVHHHSTPESTPPSMPTSRKLVVHRLTPAFREGVKVVQCSLPAAPSPSQIFVRTHYAGINASDINASAGRYSPGAAPPFDIGFEAVGEVEQAGATAVARGFTPGSHVAVLKLGCFAERFMATVDRDTIFKIDKSLPSVVPLLIGGLTSSIGLEVAGEMRTNETVLITGASGGTGLFAVQLAAIAGNRVIGTCGSDDKVSTLKRLGCERPINYKTEDLETVLKAEYPNGIDLVFEGVGGRMLEACKRCLHPTNGRLVSMGFTSQYSKKDGFDSAEAKLVKTKGTGAIRGFLLKDYTHKQGEHLLKLQKLVASQQLQSVYDPQIFEGIDAIADAVEYLHLGKNTGKPVVRLYEHAVVTDSSAQDASKAVDVSDAAGSSDDNGPPVGTMERVLELQSEAFADDVPVGEHMTQWSEAKLQKYFEDGGG